MRKPNHEKTWELLILSMHVLEGGSFSFTDLNDIMDKMSDDDIWLSYRLLLAAIKKINEDKLIKRKVINN